MNLPPFVYSLKFWESATFMVAGVLALLAYFGVVDPAWAVPATALLAWVLAFLKMFGIEPELRAKMLLERYEKLIGEYEQRLFDAAIKNKKAK